MSPLQPRRLNWGCGGWVVDGWINSDANDRPGVDIVGDIREGLPIETDSLDYIVSIHALPMIPYPDLVPVLRELRRMLVPRGVIRLVLPDFEKGIAAFQHGDRDYFLVDDDDARTLGGKFIVHMLWFGYSVSLFTVDFIEELLTKAGFVDVRLCEFEVTHTSHAGITDLDNREAESLFIEATKPGT